MSSTTPSPVSPPDRRREWLFRIVAVCLSIVLVLGFAEVALRVLGVGAPPPAPADEPSFTFFAPHPRLGWDLVAGAVDHHVTPEFDVVLRISDEGLRADRLFGPSAPDGVQRIVALGDSFTFGHGVEVADAWPARLDAQLGDRVEVVNLAVTGYGTDQQLLRFEAMGERFRPDAVVLGLFVGNVFRNARDQQLGYPKPRFALRRGQLEVDNVPVPTARVAPSRWRLAHLADRGWDVAEHLGAGAAWPITGAILDRLIDACTALDARLFVTVLPRDQSVHGSGLRHRLHRHTLDRTLKLLDDRGIAHLDLTPALAAAGTTMPLYYPTDGHWNADGHRVATDALAAWLRPQLDESLAADDAP
ncbi:MAG: GDSL-type esterase/lipase family protein [Acidobacteriota bacterium]